MKDGQFFDNEIKKNKSQMQNLHHTIRCTLQAILLVGSNGHVLRGSYHTTGSRDVSSIPQHYAEINS
jgi:hypothetical protein